jgi:hypothetical protein
VFTRPKSEGLITGVPLGEVESKMVILIDNSASMNMTFKTGHSLLETAKMKANEVVQSLEGPTEIEIFQSNPFKLVYRGDRNLQVIENKISNIYQSYSNDNLWTKLYRIVNQSQDKYLNQECVIISDFPRRKAFRENTGDTHGTEYDKWYFYLVKQPKPINNISIQDISQTNEFFFKGSPVKINAKLKNHNASAQEQVPVKLQIDNKEIIRTAVDLLPNEELNLEFQHFLDGSGLHMSTLQIDSDDFSLDNSINYDFILPGDIHCTIISEDAKEGAILTSALTSITENIEEVQFSTYTINDISTIRLLDTDVLMLNNISMIPSALHNSVKQFINNGGGVIWFPGREMYYPGINLLASTFNLPFNSVDRENLGRDGQRVLITDEDHPIFSDFSISEISQILPHVDSYYEFQNDGVYQSILSLPMGAPFLIEWYIESASVFFFTSTLDISWNDFSISDSFVPLLYRMLAYLTRLDDKSGEVTVGDELIIPIAQKDLSNQWRVETPSGTSFLLLPDFNSDELIISETFELGRHHIYANGQEYTTFSTRLDSSENPENRININEIKSVLKDAGGVYEIEPEDSLISVLKSIRYGKSLWQIFFFIFMILFIIEVYITKSRKTNVYT